MAGLGRANALRASGGTSYNPKKKPSPKPSQQTSGGLVLPPDMTYDPAIAAQLRASQRGLADRLAEIRTAGHFDQRNLRQNLRDIRTKTSRSRRDTQIGFNRGVQRFGFQEEDTRIKAGRANEDFRTQLANIGRQFAQLGRTQFQGANAAGVLSEATLAASAAARAQNQTLAEQPIHTARARLQEDLATMLSRIETGRGQLAHDRDLSLGRLHQDRDRGRRLERQDFGRRAFLRRREGQLVRREGVWARADLTQQAIYAALQNRPGAFTRTGRRRRGR